jgi:hypothetical protein
MSGNRILAYAAKYLQPVETRKDQVEQDQVGLFTTNRFQRLRAVLSDGHLESFAVQETAKEVDDAVHVFDDEYLCHERL